jgi:MFS family permease
MHRRILFSASVFHGLNDAAGVIVPLTFPLLYSQQVILSRYADIGILSNLGLLVTLVFQVVIAQTSERYEFRTLLLGSVAGLAATLFLISTASTFLALLGFYGLFRMFASFYHPLGIAWVSRTHPDRNIDKAMGIQGGSGDLGVFIAYLFTGFLLQKSQWTTPLVAWGIVCLVFGAVSYFAVRKVSTRTQTFSPPRFGHWLETLAMIKVFIPGIIFEGAGWAITVYYAPSLFNHKFGLPLGRTGLCLALWIGIGTLVTYFFGALSRKVGRMTLTLLGCSGSALALLLLGFAAGPGVAVPGIVLLGACLFILYPAFQSFVGNTVPASRQALAFSLVANIQVLSGAVVVLGAGFLADRFGLSSTFLMMGSLGLAVGVFYAARAVRTGIKG